MLVKRHQEFDLLCFPKDQEEDFCFDYSYFENLLHEEAKIDVETGRIQSYYIGSGQFEMAVQALYFWQRYTVIRIFALITQLACIQKTHFDG